MLDHCQQDVKLVELVSSGHTALNGHIKVVDGPLPQIFHAILPFVQVVVDQRLELGPLVKQVSPML